MKVDELLSLSGVAAGSAGVSALGPRLGDATEASVRATGYVGSQVLGHVGQATKPADFRPRQISSQILLEAMSAVNGTSSITDAIVESNRVVGEGIAKEGSSRLESLSQVGSVGATNAKECLSKLREATTDSNKAEVQDVARGNVYLVGTNRTWLGGNNVTVVSDTNLTHHAPHVQTVASNVVVSGSNSVLHVGDLHHTVGKTSTTIVDGEHITRSGSQLQVSDVRESVARTQKVTATESLEQVSTSYKSYSTDATIVGLNEVNLESYSSLNARGSDITLLAAPLPVGGDVDEGVEEGEGVLPGTINIYTHVPGGELSGQSISPLGISSTAATSTFHTLGSDVRISGGMTILQSSKSTMSLSGVVTFNTLPPLPIPPVIELLSLTALPEMPALPEVDPCKLEEELGVGVNEPPIEIPNPDAPTTGEGGTTGEEGTEQGDTSTGDSRIPSGSQRVSTRSPISMKVNKGADPLDPRNTGVLDNPRESKLSAVSLVASDVYLRRVEEVNLEEELSIGLDAPVLDLGTLLSFEPSTIRQEMSRLGVPGDAVVLTQEINQLVSSVNPLLALEQATGLLAEVLTKYPDLRTYLVNEIETRMATLATGLVELGAGLFPGEVEMVDNAIEKYSILSLLSPRLGTLFRELGYGEYLDVATLSRVLSGDGVNVEELITQAVSRNLEKLLGGSNVQLARGLYDLARRVTSGEEIDLRSEVEGLLPNLLGVVNSDVLSDAFRYYQMGEQVYDLASQLVKDIEAGDIESIIQGGNLESLVSTGLGQILGERNSALISSGFGLVRSGFNLGKTLTRLPGLLSSIQGFSIPSLLQIQDILNCLSLFDQVRDVVDSVFAIERAANAGRDENPSRDLQDRLLDAIDLLEDLPLLVQVLDSAASTYQSLSDRPVERERLLEQLLPVDSTVVDEVAEREELRRVLVNAPATLTRLRLDACLRLPKRDLALGQVEVTRVTGTKLTWNLVNRILYFGREMLLPGRGDVIQARVSVWRNNRGTVLYPYQSRDGYTPDLVNFLVEDYNPTTNQGTAVYEERSFQLVDGSGNVYRYSGDALGTRLLPTYSMFYLL